MRFSRPVDIVLGTRAKRHRCSEGGKTLVIMGTGFSKRSCTTSLLFTTAMDRILVEFKVASLKGSEESTFGPRVVSEAPDRILIYKVKI